MGSDIKARNVICILHDEPEIIHDLCSEFPSFEYDTEFSGKGHDERMSKAFAISDNTVGPSLTDEDNEAVLNHRNVCYVLSRPLNTSNAIEEALLALSFVDRCFELGAFAIKSESSGLTHGRQKWRELVEQDGDASLYWAWVRRPLDDDGIFYSCGFHLLGLPDIEVIGEPVFNAIDLMDIFAMYILVDRPGDRLQSGNTFSLSDDSPKYRIRNSACDRYEQDIFFYNPYGYWRLERM